MNSHIDLKKPVLVIDDEADIRDLMELTLIKMGLSVQTAAGVAEAKKALRNHAFSLVLTDMRMPDGSGLEIVDYITAQNLDIPIAVITAYGNAAQAVEALKNGAFDYLQKPITLAQLRTLVKSVITINNNAAETEPGSKMATEPQQSDKKLKNKPASGKVSEIQTSARERLLGNSPLIAEVRELIGKLAKSNVPVYIAGESGSGKEQAARSIHEQSARRDKAFVAVNCGAIPEALMESEFFGYKKGSFTGADTDRAGFFLHADGGTLFLDEVADLPLSMQVKLLRAIQERAVRRIGEMEEKQVDVRIICATHKDLNALVESGQFRQDLFYRLNVVSITMPPLRELRDDLPQLIQVLLQRILHDETMTLTAAAEKALLQYSYPGNFRELENILERAIALSKNQIIEVDDLQIHSHQLDAQSTVSTDSSSNLSPDSHALPQDFQFGHTQIQDYLDDVERHILQQALVQTRYNRTQAAKLLGISFRSMRYRMERLGIA
ncbi:sigma-54-dependent transcriptional regulator [Snodgrassella alvi]|uniref:sigma-54-dependent transcriptional regulator n=1 Tax=Snodgrassella alvi TaxID=1196083 RepID=UPI000C1EFF79|nr:sigma-54 dependent transcriptional regulator [Snodgrassella alvi]PIT15830.1 transcriptional regulator [Snodgrassella alvi]PIT18982.1 transcriptional regulator [Snodgrassella alvi]